MTHGRHSQCHEYESTSVNGPCIFLKKIIFLSSLSLSIFSFIFSLSLFHLVSSLFHTLCSCLVSPLSSYLVLSCLSSFNFSCLVSSLLFHLLLSCLVFSCLLSLSLSVSFCLCLHVMLCVVLCVVLCVRKNPEHREASQHGTSHGTNSFNDKRNTPERWRECGVCLASHPTADLNGEGRQRSSPSAAAAVPPRGTEPSPAENAHTIMSCKLRLQHSDLQQ